MTSEVGEQPEICPGARGLFKQCWGKGNLTELAVGSAAAAARSPGL